MSDKNYVALIKGARSGYIKASKAKNNGKTAWSFTELGRRAYLDNGQVPFEGFKDNYTTTERGEKYRSDQLDAQTRGNTRGVSQAVLSTEEEFTCGVI